MSNIETAIYELKEICRTNANQNESNLRGILTELRELGRKIDGIADDVRRIKTAVQNR